MNNYIEYKGYRGSVEFSLEDNCLFGKVLGIRSLISYEGNSVAELRADFEDAIEDYLAYCKDVGKEPEKEYKGTFNVRIKPELHKDLAIYSYTANKSMNSVVEEAIAEYLTNK